MSQPGCRIVYDDDRLHSPEPGWFDAEYWRHRGQVEAISPGRGSAVKIDHPLLGAAVLKHYRRGGQMARLSRDRYLFTGFNRARSIAEYYLLDNLRAMDLPAPRPLAACCRRQGIFAKAAIITENIPARGSLADELGNAPDQGLWRAAGQTIARFHRQGVRHADLNLNNILVGADIDEAATEDYTIYLIDFDKGRLQQPAAGWQQRNLQRLRRSLDKLGRNQPLAARLLLWQALLAGYQEML